jgi:hypothetical protein
MICEDRKVRSPPSHPAIVLAVLAAASGTLGSHVHGGGYGEAPGVGIYMVLAGVWFGLVVAFGLWRWGNTSWSAAALAFSATWLGWELAVNFAMHLEEHWLKSIPIAKQSRMYVSGCLAGAVGALATWAGAAASTRALRRPSVPASIVVAGAALGLLLPISNDYDSPAILLVPWQIAVASLLGVGLGRSRDAQPRSTLFEPANPIPNPTPDR